MRYFAKVFEWTGRSRNITVDNPAVIARLHVGGEGGAIYALNPTRSEQKVTIGLGAANQSLKLDGYLLGNRRRPNRRGASPRHPDSEVAQLERDAGPARGNGSAHANGLVTWSSSPSRTSAIHTALQDALMIQILRLMKLCAQEEIAHRMISVTAKCHQNSSER